MGRWGGGGMLTPTASTPFVLHATPLTKLLFFFLSKWPQMQHNREKKKNTRVKRRRRRHTCTRISDSCRTGRGCSDIIMLNVTPSNFLRLKKQNKKNSFSFTDWLKKQPQTTDYTAPADDNNLIYLWFCPSVCWAIHLNSVDCPPPSVHFLLGAYRAPAATLALQFYSPGTWRDPWAQKTWETERKGVGRRKKERERERKWKLPRGGCSGL